MNIKKGTKFKLNSIDGNIIYTFVGKWDSDIVLSPVNSEDMQCLIYTKEEFQIFLKGEYFIMID